MQRIISFLLCLVFLLTICGCKEETENKQPSSSVSTSASDDKETVSDLFYNKDENTHVVKNKDAITSFAIFSDAHIGQNKIHKRNLETAICLQVRQAL